MIVSEQKIVNTVIALFFEKWVSVLGFKGNILLFFDGDVIVVVAVCSVR